MSEEPATPGMPPEALPPSPEAMAALAEAETFITDIAPNLGRLFGMNVQMEVGQLPEGAGMATTETGKVIVDPRFFVETGKGSADAGAYGMLHETASHLRRIVTAPALSERITEFSKQGKPQALFYNILEDVAGNNLIHAALPRFKSVAKGLYREQLFPETDYTELPRHFQFLYKILREGMVPDESVTVLPEVDEALAGLRDYQGQGDVVTYSTSVAKSAHEIMGLEERHGIWTNIIYPVYEQLLEQDRQDERFQQQPGEQGEPGQDSQPGEGQENGEGQPGQSSESGNSPEQSESSQSGEPGQSDQQKFGQFYEDYSQSRHPEPLGEDGEHSLQEHAKEQARDQSRSGQRPPSHETMLDQKLRDETGHSLREQRSYDSDILKWQGSIQEMRDVFQTVIHERVALKRGLSRRSFPEGAVLDPDRLVRTFIDVRNNVERPDAFRDYERKKGQTETIGKTDYIFLFDVSGSMNQGGKAEAAASSAVIGLEGLAALQRDIEEAEAAHKMELDLDIRTAMYTFGEDVTCLKPLSTRVSPKERLDAHAALVNPNDGATRDFLAVEALEALPDESDRRRIAIVISDGETYDPTGAGNSTRTRRSIDRLRGKGWFVYGISIGSDEAERLYQPTARRVDDPERVPATIRDFIEATIS